MLNVYTILGLYLRKYDDHYHVTQYDLKTSADGVTHHYVGQNIVADYLMNEDYTTYWLDNATDGRYWTIELVHNAYVTFPFVGGGFIGYVVWAIMVDKFGWTVSLILYTHLFNKFNLTKWTIFYGQKRKDAYSRSSRLWYYHSYMKFTFCHLRLSYRWHQDVRFWRLKSIPVL